MSKDITQAEEENTAEKSTKKSANAQTEEPGVFVYIGPSIRGVIQESTIMEGKQSEIKAHLHAVVERYPQVSTLIVPIESLAECRREIKNNGTLLHKKYVELLTAE
jgi:uncharacterized protein (UPF0333 family)